MRPHGRRTDHRWTRNCILLPRRRTPLGLRIPGFPGDPRQTQPKMVRNVPLIRDHWRRSPGHGCLNGDWSRNPILQHQSQVAADGMPIRIRFRLGDRLNTLLHNAPYETMTEKTVNCLDWNEIQSNSGFHKIACLKPERIRTTRLETELDAWLNVNQGAINYIDQRRDLLIDPCFQRPWVKSIIVATFQPRKIQSPLMNLPAPKPGEPYAEIAPYALNEDYHTTGLNLLEDLKTTLVNQCGEAQFDPNVDTGPVPEKALALCAGLGSNALNSLLYDQELGCSAHIAVMFTSLDLPQRIKQAPENCPNCGRCAIACPTGAFQPNSPFRVRRCRAYIANELRGPLDWNQQKLLGTTLFGCGKCTAACPSAISQAPLRVDPMQILNIPTAELARIIKNTALNHAGTTVIKRNAAAALGQQLSARQRRDIAPELIAKSNSPTIKQTIQNWSL